MSAVFPVVAVCLDRCDVVCCVADNEMIRSFANPNYGLDALNSNCLLPSPTHTSRSDVIVDNVASLAGNRRYATFPVIEYHCLAVI